MFGRVAEAVFQITRYRHVDCAGKQTRMRYRFVAGDFPVRSSQRRSRGGARGGDCGEAEAGEQLRRAGIESVRNDEGARLFMQRSKLDRLVVLSRGHEVFSVA